MSAPAVAPPETPTTWREAIGGVIFGLLVLGGLTAAAFSAWPDSDAVSADHAETEDDHAEDGEH